MLTSKIFGGVESDIGSKTRIQVVNTVPTEWKRNLKSDLVKVIGRSFGGIYEANLFSFICKNTPFKRYNSTKNIFFEFKFSIMPKPYNLDIEDIIFAPLTKT